ncbi:MAG: iron chelate uptake ABC transporter family permease subunit [Sulfitobacter dubius]|uniref:ABC transporter permease n=1 Tax=Sulfitobacter dubius TaxID=218673 RepID=UPI0008ED85A7|nr:iron chelate uptake ABC transporter family permease subunit [Sulfitobacter dubius]SFH35486.1 iron complex transport system permease protein [Sulfitobacter dubius]
MRLRAHIPMTNGAQSDLRHLRNALICGFVLAVLSVASLLVGATGIGLVSLMSDPNAWDILLISRVPRTAALIIAGTSSAIMGAIVQRLVSNRFVEPSTMGTIDCASFGLLLGLLFAPNAAPMGRMLIAAAGAWIGTAFFMILLRTVPLKSPLMPPLLGIAFGGVIGAMTSFIAYRFDLMQSLSAWSTADFSVVLKERYELLYIAAAVTGLGWLLADRFTLAGLGDNVARGLGLNPLAVLAIGITIVAGVSGAIVVTVGFIPFLGLVVPNLIARWRGDNLRRSLPLVAWLGAALTLLCDIFGRLVFHPYDLPIGVTMGVLGAVIFLGMILRKFGR